MKTIKDIFKSYHKKTDYLDLELIISHTIDKPREFVLAHPEKTVNSEQRTRISKMIKRRIKHEPLAYILGHKEFYGLDFKVNKNTLIPRPETELLADEALQIIKTFPPKADQPLAEKHKNNITLIDTGAGSGNIIISLAVNNKQQIKNNIKLYGTDISAKALLVAKCNAKKYEVDKKIKFLKGNLLKPLIKKLETKKLAKPKDKKLIIIANLPYLDAKWKNLLKSSDGAGLKYEPRVALAGGKDGLKLYRKLAEQTRQIKNNFKKIIILCEIGHLQKNEMKKIFSFAKKIEFKKDLAGKWRVCKMTL